MKKREPSLPLKPVGGDPGTPRALLPKGSPEWCYRTIDRLRYALDQVHVTESHFDEVVEELVEYRAWERIPSSEAPYGSLDAMLKAELGLSPEEARRKKVVQQAALKTTKEDVPEGQGERTDLHDSCKSSQKKRAEENEVSYQTQQRLDRLAKDFPALHERVKAGELSVHRACIEAGIAEPTFACPLDPARAARRIAGRFKGEALDALIQALQEERTRNCDG